MKFRESINKIVLCKLILIKILKVWVWKMRTINKLVNKKVKMKRM